jgi:uncharacterized protein (TIGR02996 family)
MSVDLALQFFVETKDLDSLREPLEQRLADDEDLAFVLVPLERPSGVWLTLADGSQAPNVSGFGETLASATRCRTHELFFLEDDCSLTTFTPGKTVSSDVEEGLDDESVEERLAALLDVEEVERPDEWSGELEALPSVTVAQGDAWKKVTAPLRPATAKSAKLTGDGPFDLPALLELWRQTRAPEVSELVDALSIVGKPPYPKSASAAAKEQRWLSAAKLRRSEDLPALLATLHDGHSTDVAQRVAALDAWPDDPRIASAFARLFEQPAHLNISTMHLWTLLAERVVRHADPRTKARLDAVAALGLGWTSLFRPHARQAIGELLETTRKRLGTAIASSRRRALTSSERERVAMAAPRADAAVALAAVFQAPDDLTRRLVYADMLSEAGDPRGEFISLQCLDAPTPAQRRRATALLAKHGEAWAKPLHVAGSVLAWERGFPAVFEVSVNARSQLSPVLGDPAWATIHTICLLSAGSGATPVEVVLHPSMTHLRRVEGLEASDVRAMAKLGRALTFRSLVIESNDEKLLKLLTAERFPALLHVQLEGERVTRTQVDFMSSRPGVHVTVGPSRYRRARLAHPDTLEPLSAQALATLVARVENAERAVERAAVRERTVPSKRELEKALASGDHVQVMDLLDRAARLGADALQASADQVFASEPPKDLLAAAVGPVMRQLTLTADQWVDLAEGGALNDNNAVMDIAIGKANEAGASNKRLQALAKAATNKRAYSSERLRSVLSRLRK